MKLEGMLPSLARRARSSSEDSMSEDQDSCQVDSPTSGEVFDFKLDRALALSSKRNKQKQKEDAYNLELPFDVRIRMLEKRQHEPHTIDVLKYWQGLQKVDPEMAAVAAVALAVPVTQVTVERALSQLPLILTDRRMLTGDATLKHLLLLRLREYY